MTLSLRHVSIERNRRRIVSDISLTVRAGEMVAIAGPNGSGKSTLLAAISGELKCAAGQILYEEKSIEQWTLEKIAKRRAVLLQDSPLSFPFSVIDVVLMGRSPHHQGLETDHDIKIAHDALELVGLAGFGRRTYTQLSGGEKQRVHLARVLSQVWPSCNEMPNGNAQTKYLILDEPTSSQDMAAQHLVLSSAKAFSREGAGVLCVLHDLNQAAQYADRIMLMSEGRMACIGSPTQALTPENLTGVYGLPVRVLNHASHPHPIVLSDVKPLPQPNGD